MISRRENLEFIKDQPDFRTIHDPDELLDLIDQAWITNPGMGPRDWWSSAIKIVSYGDNMGNKMGFNFGGIVPMISEESDRWGLTSWACFTHLRELCHARDGNSWTTLVMSYRDDTDEFSHEFVYGNDRPELDVTRFDINDEVVRRLRPTRGIALEEPVTTRGAWDIATDFLIRNHLECPMLKNGHYSVDRLDGGWRLYQTGTPMQDDPLADIADTNDGAVALVNDSAEVVISASQVHSHQAELAELPTHDTTWD